MCAFTTALKQKARKWCDEYEGDMAPTPAEAIRGCDVVLVCVGNDNDVTEVILGG